MLAQHASNAFATNLIIVCVKVPTLFQEQGFVFKIKNKIGSFQKVSAKHAEFLLTYCAAKKGNGDVVEFKSSDRKMWQ